jgi:hypothetical protein
MPRPKKLSYKNLHIFFPHDVLTYILPETCNNGC